jgi:hypothetical protein
MTHLQIALGRWESDGPYSPSRGRFGLNRRGSSLFRSGSHALRTFSNSRLALHVRQLLLPILVEDVEFADLPDL